MLKLSKIAHFILSAGIFILIFNILLGASITAKYSEINGPYKTNKVTVNMLDNGGTADSSSFSMDDIRNLQDISFKGTDMTYSSLEKSSVTYKDNPTEAQVYGIGDKYNMFHQTKMKYGSFITKENSITKVAVIDESLAQAIFKNDKVVGMPLKIFNQEFRIIGVIEPDESIAQTFADSGYGSVYIPVEQMLQYDDNAKLNSIEVRTLDKSTTGQNITNMGQSLSSIGKDASNYKIIDYYIENMLVEQKSLICILIPGIISIILLLFSVRKRAAEIYSIIKSSLKENYLLDVLKYKYMGIILLILEISVTVVFILIVWNAIKFDIYIPSEFVPDELIDTAFFSNLFKNLLQEGVRNVGYIPTFTEMKANILGVMQGWNLYIDLLVGLPLFYLGLKLSGIKDKNHVRNLLYLSIIVVLSMILGCALLSVFKMPAVINIQGIFIIFTFIFLSSVCAFGRRKNKAAQEVV